MSQAAYSPPGFDKNAMRQPDSCSDAELSIVIGTRNRRSMLEKCLDALVGRIKTGHRIIVVDAGSTDGTVEYLRQLGQTRGEIRLICDGAPIGQAQSLNRVFPTIKSEFICWLSDDNVVQPGALDTAVDILKTNDKIGMVALKVKDVVGRRTRLPYIGGIRKTGILNCNQGVIRSNVFGQVGYFDESFKNYGIDPDLTAKVLLAGCRVVYTKAVAIHHFPTNEAEGGAISRAEKIKNKEGLNKKYNAKYAYLIDDRICDNREMRMKRVVWRHVKKLNKRLEKRGYRIERLTGKNMKDWKNLTKARYISIFDFLRNRSRPYYLEQRLPGKILSLNENPYRILIG
jgi:GT2 family glycosyltransferase